MRRYLSHFCQLRPALALALVCLAGCSGLPPRPIEQPSRAIEAADIAMTSLGRSVAVRVAAHPGLTGIWKLADPLDAFATRALLAKAAERTLDVQYYIWHGDTTGTLLLQALVDAAERGVRVRVLLDDNGDAGLDGVLRALDGHARIEVRLFNPFVVRSPKWIGYLTDFSRANRRMHNKSFTADGAATVIGGRNIGDEYFGATEGVLFTDLDVLAIGPAVADVSADFDRYWASASAWPAAAILPAVDAAERDALRAKAMAIEHDPESLAYIDALRRSTSVQALAKGDLAFEWATTHLVSDDPAKGLGLAPDAKLLFQRMSDILSAPTRQFDLVSPYFVPTQAGVDVFTAMVRRGVKVRILTNSLEATDVAAVHAGYIKHRVALLEAGVLLYEMRRIADPAATPKKHSGGPFGSSSSSLHAKTFAVDSSSLFVGSFNFDPRSARLNTELGFVIDSPVLASELSSAFDRKVPLLAYEVRLDESGRVYWIEQRDGRPVHIDTEPGSSLMQRIGVSVLSKLPIDWLL